MGHLIDSCDFIDVLEESVTRKSRVSIELGDGTQFTDHVRDVVTEEGRDFAIFAEHGRVAVQAIARAGRADPEPSSYAGKLGQ